MSNGWGGKRANAGRKSYAHLKKCRELLGRAIDDRDWVHAMMRLACIMKGINNGPESGPIKPRESIEAAKLLMRYAFGMLEPEGPPAEEQIEPIKIIEIACAHDHDGPDDECEEHPEECTGEESPPASAAASAQAGPVQPVGSERPRLNEREPHSSSSQPEDDDEPARRSEETFPPRSRAFHRVPPNSSAPERAAEPPRASPDSRHSHQEPAHAVVRGADNPKSKMQNPKSLVSDRVRPARTPEEIEALLNERQPSVPSSPNASPPRRRS